MPFTAAHALAVVPLIHARRLRLDATCLVCGALAPDFEYFVRGARVSELSHTWLGAVVWGVPVALVLAALWHHLVAWPVLLAAPAALTRRAGATLAPGWRPHLLAAIAGALLGNATHLLWDGATHANGLFVSHWPGLATLYDVPGFGVLALHRILQYASSAVGCLGLAWYAAVVARGVRPPIDVARGGARVVFAACLAVGIAALLWQLSRRGVPADAGDIAVAVIAGGLAGTLVASALLQRAARRYADAVVS